jgi:hypothetical protein
MLFCRSWLVETEAEMVGELFFLGWLAADLITIAKVLTDKAA